MKLRSKVIRVSAVLATVVALGGGSLAVASGAFAAGTAYKVTVAGGGTIIDVDTRSADDTCPVTIKPPESGPIVVTPGGAPFEFTQEFPACDDEIYGWIKFVFTATEEGPLAVTAESQLFYDRCLGSCRRVTAATGSATYSVRSDGAPYARELVVPRTETAGANFVMAFSSTPQG